VGAHRITSTVDAVCPGEGVGEIPGESDNLSIKGRRGQGGTVSSHSTGQAHGGQLSVNAAVKRLRAALDDDADNPTFIETIPRRGYRFIAHVENGALTSSVGVEKHLAPGLPSTTLSEFWTRRRLVVAAVAAVLIVGALAAWRVRSARPKLTESDVILLATFVNKTGDPVFDNSLDKALEVKLSESPFLSVLPEADARSTMRTMRHDPNEPVTEDLGIEICKRLGLKAVVVPAISAFGSRYLITLDAIDARTQKSIARRQQEAGSKDKVIAALGKAASQLRKQLGEGLSSLEKYDAPLDLATTSSLNALQAYNMGQKLYRSGKRREAIAFFERAVELDPQFCSAYSMLGSAYHSVGDHQASRENFAKAFELKDRRLTQEENFQTTALYDSSITGNLEKRRLYLSCSDRRIHAARPPTTCWGSPMPNRAGRKRPFKSSIGRSRILRYPPLNTIPTQATRS